MQFREAIRMNQRKFIRLFHGIFRMAGHYETANTSPLNSRLLLLNISQRFRLITLPADSGSIFGFLIYGFKMHGETIQFCLHTASKLQRSPTGKITFFPTICYPNVTAQTVYLLLSSVYVALLRFFVGRTHLEVVRHGFRHVGRRDIVVVLVLGELE